MVTRTAIVLDDIQGQAGTIPLDITLEEIAVANIPGLVYWPYINDIYGRVPGSSPQALYDRLTDDALTTVASPSFSIGALPDSSPAVIIGSQNTSWRATVPEFNKGATFAAKIANTVGISSNSAPADSTFWIMDDGAGRLTFRVGSYTWAASNYDGPTLTPGTAVAVIFRIDALTGTVTLRVGGSYTKIVQDDVMRSAALHPNFQFGLVNNEGSLTSRFGNYGHLLAFDNAISDADMDAVLEMM
ncbi:hypothetical protein [Entomohabitans teleogrylli]|uniref:hypothetical protein n=1 Tax=Entomohabitans teleogrylli TaxID=1384589 RepID=UPI00073D7EDB|nr:hypothetical protein [Entomohabitans teleogrylli]